MTACCEKCNRRWPLIYFITAASDVSKSFCAAELKQGGVIGLHSHPTAEKFYRKCGMIAVERDSIYDDQWYFELTSKAASDFLGEGGWK